MPRTPGSSLVAVVRADLAASTDPRFREQSAAVFWFRSLARLVIGPNVRAVVSFRVSHRLAERGLLPVALWLKARTFRRSGADLHPRATIGPGLYLVHSSGVVIGPDVTLGSNCRMHQGVTLGGPVEMPDGRWVGPTVGNDSLFGAHAVVLGTVRLGDRVRIGANAVVTTDVPDDTTVAGVPARPVTPR